MAAYNLPNQPYAETLSQLNRLVFKKLRQSALSTLVHHLLFVVQQPWQAALFFLYSSCDPVQVIIFALYSWHSPQLSTSLSPVLIIEISLSVLISCCSGKLRASGWWIRFYLLFLQTLTETPQLWEQHTKWEQRHYDRERIYFISVKWGLCFCRCLFCFACERLNWHSVARGTVPFAFGHERGNPRPFVTGMKSRKKVLNIYFATSSMKREGHLKYQQCFQVWPRTHGKWRDVVEVDRPPVCRSSGFNKLLFGFNVTSGSV